MPVATADDIGLTPEDEAIMIDGSLSLGVARGSGSDRTKALGRHVVDGYCLPSEPANCVGKLFRQHMHALRFAPLPTKPRLHIDVHAFKQSDVWRIRK